MKNFDAIVIGAGPGGYVCAIRLAQLGKKTAVIDKAYWGGVCLNVGCIPSKALIYAATQHHKMTHEAAEMGLNVSGVKVDPKKLQEWKGTVVKKLTGGVAGLLKSNKVEMFKGNATFKDAKTLEVKTETGVETLTAPNIVIATGSRPVEIPTLKYNGKNVVDSTGALEFAVIPPKLTVVGGGIIGLEIGTAYAKLGSEVTIVEMAPQLLGSVDSELVAVVEKKARKMGIKVLTSTKVLGLKESDAAKAATLHLEVEGADKAKQTIEATHILVSAGRKPNTDGIGLEKLGIKLDQRGNILTDNQSKTGVGGVYAIGDAAGAPQLAHRASMDGLLVAHNIAGEKSFKDYKSMPWAVFCDPEIAVCGLTEKEAQEKGIKYRVGKFPFVANGRALSTNETDGFIKVLTAENNETILGVHMVGPEVSNLIAEANLAVEMGACAEDIIRTVHTHPTLPEAFPEAVEAAVFQPIHIFKPPTAGAGHGRPSAHPARV
ncbi:dihydrolipoyl dehydrogenase [bacterium]|nr:dihydrolipoyl dehydrogenase [bacterium]